MIVTNPTKNDITVNLGGTEYTVEANSSISNVPKELAVYWKNKLHTFLTISEEEVDAPKSKSTKLSEEEKEAVEEILNSESDETESTDATEVVGVKVKAKGKTK